MIPWIRVAPELLPWMLGLLLLNVFSILWIGSTWALFLLLPVALLAWIFREPKRIIPHAPLGLVSPVDGVVSAVEKGRAPMLDREAIRICIQKAYLDPCAIRSPTEGKVREQSISHRGVNGYWRCLTLVETDEGDAVVRVVSLRRLPRRLRLYMQSGERVGQGQRCGFLPLTATIEVYCPLNTNIKVRIGEKVQAGSSLLGHLVHKEAVSAIKIGGGGPLPDTAAFPYMGTHGGT